MLKFKSEDIGYIKFDNKNGTFSKSMRHTPLKEIIDFSTKQGAVVDKRLTIQLDKYITKSYIPVSAIRLLASRMFRCGKKRKAENMVARSLFILRQMGIKGVLANTLKAIETIKVPAALRVYKKGRKTIFVPYLMRPEAANHMAARIILNMSRKRPENGMVASLAAELYDIINGKGYALEYKTEFQTKVAENYGSYRQIRKRRRKKGQFRK